MQKPSSDRFRPTSRAERALVMIADIVDSRDLPADERRNLQEWLRAQGERALEFRFTGGDEFEWRLPATGEAFDSILVLRATLAAGLWGGPPVLLRCALGVGAIYFRADEGPYAEDGPAYHRARQALGILSKWGAQHNRRFDAPFAPAGGIRALTAACVEEQDVLLDALLLQMDGQLTRWTQAQWQVIALHLQGLRQTAIGERLGANQSTIASRLRAADIDRYLVAHQAVRARLVGEEPSPQGGD